ncbi:hypothetical protein [Arthrobacter sp. MW3 TE3886]|uniref:hypothetical protein n=1 Tax=Arthrobacter sp. MW3 TE3886 TaxID=3156254 RepID=UPI00351375B4
MPDALTVDKLLEQPFKIHTLNAYDHVGLQSMSAALDLSSGEVQKLIRIMHHRLVTDLASGDIAYKSLEKALITNREKREAAFLFDWSAITNAWYGLDISHAWLPALRKVGPAKTSIRLGDILNLPTDFLWKTLEEFLVRERDFPRTSTEQYYVVYLTNLSKKHLQDLHESFLTDSQAYLGYVDCSCWNPLKAALLLPQFGVRAGDVIITAQDDDGNANLPGYPLGEFGFTSFGVDEDLYGMLLSHRFDNGVPEWADDDSSIALKVLGGSSQPLSGMNLTMTDSRFEYLHRGHGSSLQMAGLTHLDKAALEGAIMSKLANNLVFNLAFQEGLREGVPTPELDTMKLNVQVEFPDENGVPRRFLAALKYFPSSNTLELITLY